MTRNNEDNHQVKINSTEQKREIQICCQDERSALSKGVALVEDILEAGGDKPLLTTPALLPNWYNHNLIIRGQDYFSANLFNMFVAKLSGLLSLLTSPSILGVLRATNKSSEPITAYKRYLQTILKMMAWYQSDLRNPNSSGRMALESVRKHHTHASKVFGPITQKDMALTQFGFVGFALCAYDRLGLPKEQTGLIHLWRVVGHMLGIQDRFNLCRGCNLCTKMACREMARRVFGPGLDEPPEHFDEMSKALLDGVWPMVPFLNQNAFMEHTRRLCGQAPKQLNLIPTMNLYLQMFVHKMLQINIISFFLSPVMNFQIWLTIFVQQTMPVLAFTAFGQ